MTPINGWGHHFAEDTEKNCHREFFLFLCLWQYSFYSKPPSAEYCLQRHQSRVELWDVNVSNNLMIKTVAVMLCEPGKQSPWDQAQKQSCRRQEILPPILASTFNYHSIISILIRPQLTYVPWEDKFPPETCSKNLSTYPSASAGEPSTELGQSKTVELVSETRFVLFILSVGLKSGYGIIFLKVLWHRNPGECLGLFLGTKGKRKGT